MLTLWRLDYLTTGAAPALRAPSAVAALRASYVRPLSVASALRDRAALLERVQHELTHEKSEGQPPAPLDTLGDFTVCFGMRNGKERERERETGRVLERWKESENRD